MSKISERIEQCIAQGDYLSDMDITEILGISQRTLNNKVCRGDDLPVYIKPRGCRKRLWPKPLVQEWLSTSRSQVAE